MLNNGLLTENLNTLIVVDTSLNLRHEVFGPQPESLSGHKTLHGLQQSKLQLSLPEETSLQALPKMYTLNTLLNAKQFILKHMFIIS